MLPFRHIWLPARSEYMWIKMWAHDLSNWAAHVINSRYHLHFGLELTNWTIDEVFERDVVQRLQTSSGLRNSLPYHMQEPLFGFYNEVLSFLNCKWMGDVHRVAVFPHFATWYIELLAIRLLLVVALLNQLSVLFCRFTWIFLLQWCLSLQRV